MVQEYLQEGEREGNYVSTVFMNEILKNKHLKCAQQESEGDIAE